MSTNPTQDDPTAATEALARRKDRGPVASDSTLVRRADGSIDWQAKAARLDAEQVERDRIEQEAAAAEQARVSSLPVADAEVDADAEVAALEQRIAEGDESVTAAQLAEERTNAQGRVRFARLRQVFADRTARNDAERVEQEQAAAAEEHAREALAPFSPAVVVERYDAAVDALRALTATLDGRNATLRTLATLPPADRVRGAVDRRSYLASDVIPLDGVKHQAQPTGEVIRPLLGAARIVGSNSGYRVIGASANEYVDGRDPRVIAEARAQLAESA